MASFENPVAVFSFPVTSDLSGKQFNAVSLSSGALVVAPVAARAIGILQNDPNGSAAANAGGSVMSVGISRAVADAVIAEGAKVAPGATAGRLRTAVTGDHVVGIALEAAAGANAIFSLQLAIGGAPLP